MLLFDAGRKLLIRAPEAALRRAHYAASSSNARPDAEVPAAHAGNGVDPHHRRQGGQVLVRHRFLARARHALLRDLVTSHYTMNNRTSVAQHCGL